MGLAVAGIVFQRPSGMFDADKILSALFPDNFQQLEKPSNQFDTRKDEYVSIEIFGDICFVYSTFIATPFVFDGSENISEIYKALEKPSLILAFCHFDSGGSYGYALFENGKKTRRRLFSNDKLTEEGSPKQFELDWINADTYIENPDDPPEEHQKIYFKNNHAIEVSEYNLTSRLLYEALEKYFGACPWEKELPNSKKFYYRKIVSLKNAHDFVSFILPSAVGVTCAGLAWIMYRRRKFEASNNSNETPETPETPKDTL